MAINILPLCNVLCVYHSPGPFVDHLHQSKVQFLQGLFHSGVDSVVPLSLGYPGGRVLNQLLTLCQCVVTNFPPLIEQYFYLARMKNDYLQPSSRLVELWWFFVATFSCGTALYIHVHVHVQCIFSCNTWKLA